MPPELVEGLVVYRAGDKLAVEVNGELFRCDIPKKFLLRSVVTGGVVVGDRVRVRVATRFAAPERFNIAGRCGLNAALTRKNLFLRGDPYSPVHPQGIAANLDRILVMASVCEPATPLGLVDRLLAAAEACQTAETLLVWNKCDFLPPDESFERFPFVAGYRNAGYAVFGISALYGEFEKLRAAVDAGRTLLVGGSGVGKTTLLNAWLPGAQFVTREISRATGKGTHVTSVARLVRLPSAAELVDTPGIKAMSLCGVWDDISEAFPEFEQFSGQCRFADCRHAADAGCAVRDAAERGNIMASRYASYRSLLDEQRANDERSKFFIKRRRNSATPRQAI